MFLFSNVFNKQLLSCVFLSLFVFYSSIALSADDAAQPPAPEPLLEGKALVDALREGGYIIYFRHGLTDHSRFDTDRKNLENCLTQRPLSAEGRRQMRGIGEAISALDIQVSNIISSPYCRSIDTAELAFGKAEIDYNLRHTVTADAETAAAQAIELKKLLSTPPAPGTNTVISGHTANLQEASGIWPKPEGVAIIFKPDGAGNFVYISRVVPDLWSELAENYEK